MALAAHSTMPTFNSATAHHRPPPLDFNNHSRRSIYSPPTSRPDSPGGGSFNSQGLRNQQQQQNQSTTAIASGGRLHRPAPLPPANARNRMSGGGISGGANRMSGTTTRMSIGPGGVGRAGSFSLTPKEEDLRAFERLCIALYYDQDSSASKQIDSTLKSLHPSHRPHYSKVQAAVRSQFHLDASLQRKRLLSQLLEETKPNLAIFLPLFGPVGSTSSTTAPSADVENGLSQVVTSSSSSSIPGATNINKALNSKEARNKRYAALMRYLHTHGSDSLPGTHPFLRSLWAALDLQSRERAKIKKKKKKGKGNDGKPPNNKGKGGAGDRRIEWEVDEAALMEAGGGDWMKDTVVMLKGILGFEERVVETHDFDSRPTSAYTVTTTEEDDSSLGHGSPTAAPPARQLGGYCPRDAQEVDGSLSKPPQRRQPPPPPPSRKHASRGADHEDKGDNEDEEQEDPTIPEADEYPPPPPISDPSQLPRSRSGSDPFVDPGEKRSRRPSLLGYGAAGIGRRQGSASADDDIEMNPPSSVSPPVTRGMGTPHIKRTNADDEEGSVDVDGDTTEEGERNHDEVDENQTEGLGRNDREMSPTSAATYGRNSSQSQGNKVPPPRPPRPYAPPHNSYTSTASGETTTTAPTPPTSNMIAIPRESATSSTTPRVFVFTISPHLRDPELQLLCSLFPSYLVTKSVRDKAWFDEEEVSPNGVTSPKDLEEGLGTVGGVVGGRRSISSVRTGPEVRVGHGVLRIGKLKRDDGYKGGLISRMRLWFKRMLGG